MKSFLLGFLISVPEKEKKIVKRLGYPSPLGFISLIRIGANNGMQEKASRAFHPLTLAIGFYLEKFRSVTSTFEP